MVDERHVDSCTLNGFINATVFLAWQVILSLASDSRFLYT